MVDFVLYNAPQSTCSQRVRFTLHAKHLPFNEIALDLFAGDQLKPEYLAINPNGVVPTLVHRGESIIDSSVIVEYLEELQIRPRMRPSRLLDRARMRSMMRYFDEVPTPAIRIPSYNLAFLPHFQSLTESEFRALAESKPLRREFLLSMGRTGFSATEMDAALGRLERSMDWLSNALIASGGPWLLGSHISLADIAILPVVARMADIRLDRMWDNRPKIAAFLEAVRNHPAYGLAFYEGSLLSEKYPHLRSMLAKSGQRMT